MIIGGVSLYDRGIVCNGGKSILANTRFHRKSWKHWKVWDIRHLQAYLVLEPTRELAVQVSEEMFHIGRKKRLKVPAVFGGFPIDKQIQTLRQKSHIVTGTPGRIMNHLGRESLKLDYTPVHRRRSA